MLDAASDYASCQSDPYYGDTTLSPGKLEYYQESPGPGESSVLSPARAANPQSPGYTTPTRSEAFYRSHSRGSPTRRDRTARSSPPAAHPPCCVCEMCTCGKHSCPKHGVKKTGRTPRVRSRFEGQASYARDYVPPPVEALRDAFGPPREAEGPQGSPRSPTGRRPPFEGSSSYKRDYTTPPLEAFKSSRGVDVTPPKGRRPPFEGQSSSRRDYQAPPPEAYAKEKEKKRAASSAGKRPPFEGQAMHKKDYAPPPKEAYM